MDDFDPGWVAEDHYRILSMSFTVRSTDEGFARALASHLAPFRRAAPEVQAFPVDLYVQERDAAQEPPPYSLFIANILRYKWDDVSEVVRHAVWALQSEVPKRTRDFLLLHAGAVTTDGGAMLLPGTTGSGKSSLVLSLVREGFGYLSDELAVIDPVTSRAYPFEKSIDIGEEGLRFFDGLPDRHDAASPLSKRSIWPEDVHGTVSPPARPKWIVFLGEDRSGSVRLTPVARSEAVERMARYSTNLYRYGERGVVLLSRVVEGADAFELEGGTPIERARALAERVA